jgi:hypothetical protein
MTVLPIKLRPIEVGTVKSHEHPVANSETLDVLSERFDDGCTVGNRDYAFRNFKGISTVGNDDVSIVEG